MTSVGYGELSPISETGKIISVIAAFMGVSLQALMVICTNIFFERSPLELLSYALVNIVDVKQSLKVDFNFLYFG